MISRADMLVLSSLKLLLVVVVVVVLLMDDEDVGVLSSLWCPCGVWCANYCGA